MVYFIEHTQTETNDENRTTYYINCPPQKCLCPKNTSQNNEFIGHEIYSLIHT